MTSSVEHYLISGCGRCELYDTPGCRVHKWQDVIVALRGILLSCGLTEEMKWGSPCYSFQKKNVVIIGALKESCTLGFFKGALLSNAAGLLDKPGDNSQSTRVLRFSKLSEIIKHETAIREYIFEAIEAERAGLKVEVNKKPLPLPEELIARFKSFPELKAAFEALTPGRQRGYILYFSEAKQSATRASRIEKYIPKILEGKGFLDDYKKK